MKGTIYLHGKDGMICESRPFIGNRKALRNTLGELSAFNPHFQRDDAEIDAITASQELSEHRRRMYRF